MSANAATNRELLRVLGIKQRNITAMQIVLRPEMLPVVSMECLIDASTLLNERTHFDLVLRQDTAPAAPPPLNVRAMCAAVNKALDAELGVQTSLAVAYQRCESAAILARMDKAIQQRRLAGARALSKGALK